MKKVLSLLLAVIMLVSLVACGGKNNTGNDDGKTNDAGTTNTKTETDYKDKQEESAKVEVEKDETAEYAKELTIAIGAGSLDPGDGWNSAREAFHRMVFDTLFYYDETTGEYEMQLAKSVEWVEGGVQALHIVLRDDVVFSNGDPVTTADVEFSFERATYSNMSKFYDHSEIISDTEMIVHLSAPFLGFYTCLSRAYCSVVCKAEAEKHPEGLALIGSGPYKYDMDSYVVDNSITVVPNDKFWGEKNPTEKITFVKIADASAAAVALQNNEINFMTSINETEVSGMKTKENLEVVEFEGFNFLYAGFNDRRDSTVITDEEIAFRRAVICAINKDEIIAGIGGGGVMTCMWPYTHPAYIASESEYDVDLSYNPEKAKEYLAQAGGKTEFNVLVDGGKSWCKVAAQVIQEQCRQVGITMNYEETDSTGFTAMTKWDADDYEAYIHSNLFSSRDGTYNLITVGNNVNRSRFADPKVTEAGAAAQAAMTIEDQVEHIQYFQKVIHDMGSYIPIAWRISNFGYTKGLQGFDVAASTTYQFRNVCLRTN